MYFLLLFLLFLHVGWYQWTSSSPRGCVHAEEREVNSTILNLLFPQCLGPRFLRNLFCNNERLFCLSWESLIAYWRYMEEELSYSFAIILLTVKLLSSTMYVLSRRERIMEFNLKLTLCWKDWLGVLQLNENTCSTHFDNYIYKPHSNWKGSNVSQIWEFKWVLNFS